MDTSRRRKNIMRLLYTYRHMTTRELAAELNVSERTVRRDIELLSLSEPIYTQMGRYDGGVYISDDHRADKLYYSEDELEVIHKMAQCVGTGTICTLTPDEQIIVDNLCAHYSNILVKRNSKKAITNER